MKIESKYVPKEIKGFIKEINGNFKRVKHKHKYIEDNLSNRIMLKYFIQKFNEKFVGKHILDNYKRGVIIHGTHLNDPEICFESSQPYVKLGSLGIYVSDNHGKAHLNDLKFENYDTVDIHTFFQGIINLIVSNFEEKEIKPLIQDFRNRRDYYELDDEIFWVHCDCNIVLRNYIEKNEFELIKKDIEKNDKEKYEEFPFDL